MSWHCELITCFQFSISGQSAVSGTFTKKAACMLYALEVTRLCFTVLTYKPAVHAMSVQSSNVSS